MLERIVIQRERQRERAALMEVTLELGVGPGAMAGVEVPDSEEERGMEEGKCVICVWAET